MKYVIPLLLSVFLLSGCGVFGLNNTKGGGANWERTTVIEDYDPVEPGKVVRQTTIHDSASVDQPENPDKSATLFIDSDKEGNIKVSADSGDSQNTAADTAAIGLLSPLIWIGAGLILLSLVFIAVPVIRNFFAAGAAALTGGTLIALAYLLPTYPYIFMIAFILGGLGIATILGIYCWRLFVADKTVDASLKVTEQVREKYLTPEEDLKEFHSRDGIVNKVNPPKYVRKFVDKRKKKIDGINTATFVVVIGAIPGDQPVIEKQDATFKTIDHNNEIHDHSMPLSHFRADREGAKEYMSKYIDFFFDQLESEVE